MTGAPLEFAFTSHDSDLRYTVEIGAPGELPEVRVDALRRVLARLGVRGPAPGLLEQVASWQSLGKLSYGGWLGARHSLSGGDRFKLYLEIPSEATESVELWVNGRLDCTDRPPMPAARARMVGLDAAGGRVEVYYAATDLLRTALPQLMSRAGLALAANDVLTALERLAVFPPRARLPTRDVGFSLALPTESESATFTLYFVALAMYGDDSHCARRLIEHGDEIGRTLAGYAELLQALGPAPRGLTHHGMVGLTARAPGSVPVLSAGVAATHAGSRPPTVGRPP